MSQNKGCPPVPKGENTRFKKGVSGNPAGRPKGASLKTQVQTLFIEMMAEPVKSGGKEVPFLTAFKKEFMKSALSGGWAAREISSKLFADNILDSIDRSLNKDMRENEDFQQYRVMLRAHNFQQKVLLDRSRKIYEMAGRRAGKTEGNILKAVSVAIKDNHNVAIICLTQETAMKLYFKGISDMLESLGYDVEKADRAEGMFTLANGSIISLKGNNSATDREKFRGFSWDLVIIDEVQSQAALPYLINDIIEPTLIDRAGQLILTGTGPRVRGTYWERLWAEDKNASKYNWNLSANPYIKNYEKVLDEIKAEKGLTDSSPLFQREYLGLCVYDDDAQVYRLEDSNFYNDEELAAWISKQNRSDLKFSAGLDYGYKDSDAFVIILFSTVTREKYIVYEYKGNRLGIADLADRIKAGINHIETSPLFSSIPDKKFYIYSDSGGLGKKISVDLYQQFKLPCVDAYKSDKNLAIELLQDDVRTAKLKVKRDSVFADEALKTVWARNDRDELVRVIDDTTFHPDELDATLYACRHIWINYPSTK